MKKEKNSPTYFNMQISCKILLVDKHWILWSTNFRSSREFRGDEEPQRTQNTAKKLKTKGEITEDVVHINENKRTKRKL